MTPPIDTDILRVKTASGASGAALPGQLRHGPRCCTTGRFEVIQPPNIGHVLYGREGYLVERVNLNSATEPISGMEQRRRIALLGLADVRIASADGRPADVVRSRRGDGVSAYRE